MDYSFFRHRSHHPCNHYSSCGDGERSVFEERVVDGVKKLVITGKENWKDFIESSKEETLISNILKRFENGDTSVLSRVQGFYADVSSLPSDLASAQNLLIKLKNDFSALPSEVKVKFDNSFDKYLFNVSNYSIDDFCKVFINSDLKSDNSNFEEGDSIES